MLTKKTARERGDGKRKGNSLRRLTKRRNRRLEKSLTKGKKKLANKVANKGETQLAKYEARTRASDALPAPRMTINSTGLVHIYSYIKLCKPASTSNSRPVVLASLCASALPRRHTHIRTRTQKSDEETNVPSNTAICWATPRFEMSRCQLLRCVNNVDGAGESPWPMNRPPIMIFNLMVLCSVQI